MLGKDRHIHRRIYACAHGNANGRLETVLERRRRLARERESATEYFRLVEGEGFCCSLYKQPLMNRIAKQMGVTLTPSNNLEVFKSKVCETKSLAPASNRMTETDNRFEVT